MTRFSSISFAVALSALALPTGAFSQAASGVQGASGVGLPDSRAVKLAQLYNGGMQFFEGQKYQEAITRLEDFLGQLTPEEISKRPLVYLVLGECYYGLGGDVNFMKAIDSYWVEFIRRWPADPKVVEVKGGIAQTFMKMKKWEKAIEWWKQVEQMSKDVLPMREHSLAGQAYCYRQLKTPDEEVPVLERLVYPDFNSQESAEGAVRLMALYALKHDPADAKTMDFADKAIGLLKKLQMKIHLVENFIALNGIAIKLGDQLLDVNAYPKALEAYWAVRNREVVLQMQKSRVKGMEAAMDQNIKGAGKDPVAYNKALRLNEEAIKPRLEEAKKILSEFEKLPDFMPSLYFRMARCHTDMNKKWEAIVVFNQILEDYPKSSVRELVIFSRLALYSDLGIAERSYTLCDEYLKEYPNGPHAGQVAFTKGTTAMKKKEWVVGEKYFEEALKILATLPEDQKKLYWTEARYQLANARFLQNKFDVARADFTQFVAEFGSVAEGKGAFMEDAEYQLALCHLFTGHYAKDPDKAAEGDGAIERLQAYLAKWGIKSGYGSDAKYRLGVCRFAAYENDLCVKECEEWLAAYGADPKELLQPEVYSLLGDAHAALKHPAEAATAYIEAYKRATTDEVLTYALFEAGKQLQKAGDWEGIERLYTEFVKTRAEHPAAVTAIYWVGKAKAKLGKLEEAKELVIETLKKYIADPKRESVEMMLSQLAEWARRRPPTKVSDTPAPKWDADAELERMLKPLAEGANVTAEARLLYARGEMGRINRAPEKRVAAIAAIAEKTKPEELSPHLLMEVGDYVLAKGEVDRAETLFRTLKENFPKSERVDAGWVGLGDVQLARKDYKKAMELYTFAIDRLGAPWKLKEALIGQAKCNMESAGDGADKVAKLEKAKKTFEEVASVREWRGESTAMALFYIADIQARLGKFAESTQSYERLAASQGKYPVWVARAYLGAAEGYYRQGKNEDAKKKLTDLISPHDAQGAVDEKKMEKFKDLPEIEKARKRLVELGGTV